MTPHQHGERVGAMLREAAEEAQVDIQRLNDTKAPALFERVREVLAGTIKALEDYAQQREAVWR